MFPVLRRELHAAPTLASLGAQLARFAAFTHLALQQPELVARCFLVADRLLARADEELTAAFREAYFPGLHLDRHPSGERMARELMPSCLHTGYIWHLYRTTQR